MKKVSDNGTHCILSFKKDTLVYCCEKKGDLESMSQITTYVVNINLKLIIYFLVAIAKNSKGTPLFIFVYYLKLKYGYRDRKNWLQLPRRLEISHVHCTACFINPYRYSLYSKMNSPRGFWNVVYIYVYQNELLRIRDFLCMFMRFVPVILFSNLEMEQNLLNAIQFAIFSKLVNLQ